MEYNELNHHGIRGQRWGIRRFQNKDGSLTPAGKKRYDDDDPEESYEDKKARAIKSGSATEILKYKGDLTPAERKEISERLKWENEVQNLSNNEQLVAKGKSKTEKFTEGMTKFTDIATSAAKGYNVIANLVNAFSTDEMLPKIDTNITDGNRKEYKAHKKEQEKAEDAKRKRKEQESQREKKQKERAEKRAKENVDNDDVLEKPQREKKQKERAEKRAKEAEKNQQNEKTEKTRVTVEGEGTSKSSNSNRDRFGTWFDDEVDFTNTKVSNVSSNLVSSGQSRVTALLEKTRVAVEGEGTSKSSNSNRDRFGTWFDDEVDFTNTKVSNVSSNLVSSGQSRVTALLENKSTFLLEDKSR